MRGTSGRCGWAGFALLLAAAVPAWGQNATVGTGISSLPVEAQAVVSATLGSDLLGYRVRRALGLPPEPPAAKYYFPKNSLRFDISVTFFMAARGVA
jgi:hypothetical protein